MCARFHWTFDSFTHSLTRAGDAWKNSFACFFLSSSGRLICFSSLEKSCAELLNNWTELKKKFIELIDVESTSLNMHTHTHTCQKLNSTLINKLNDWHQESSTAEFKREVHRRRVCNFILNLIIKSRHKWLHTIFDSLCVFFSFKLLNTEHNRRRFFFTRKEIKKSSRCFFPFLLPRSLLHYHVRSQLIESERARVDDVVVGFKVE